MSAHGAADAADAVRPVSPGGERSGHDLGMESLFAAGGAAGRAMAAKDWASTTLGPPREWSPSLRTAVCICLESQFSMIVMWGPELAYIYNDQCIPRLGEKHPAAMGMPLRQVWPEVWD